jgi:hypothetical protein
MNRYGHLFDGLDATFSEGLDAAHAAATPSENVAKFPVLLANDG